MSKKLSPTTTVTPIAPEVQVTVRPLALSLEDAAKVTGVPRWTIKEAVLIGTLKAKKAGRSHVVLLTELHRWIASLDDVEPSTAPSILARQQDRQVHA